jgi:hypothetical protein
LLLPCAVLIIWLFPNPNAEALEYQSRNTKEGRACEENRDEQESQRIMARRKIVVNKHDIPVEKPMHARSVTMTSSRPAVVKARNGSLGGSFSLITLKLENHESRHNWFLIVRPEPEFVMWLNEPFPYETVSIM